MRPDSKTSDKHVKSEHHLQLNTMLQNLTDIISDSFNIKFSKNQQYGVVFPPTVYELLWRYEYKVFKQVYEQQLSGDIDYEAIFDSSVIVQDDPKLAKKKPEKIKKVQ